MQVKIKLQRPGYPFIQEKWITVTLDEDQNPEIRSLKQSGYYIVKAEAVL